MEERKKSPTSGTASTPRTIDPILYLHTQKLAQAVVAGMKVAVTVEMARYELHRRTK